MIGWIAAGLSIIGCITNIFKLKICWFFWTLGALGMIYINYNLGHWDQTVLWVCYVPMNIYGYYQWRRDERNK